VGRSCRRSCSWPRTRRLRCAGWYQQPSWSAGQLGQQSLDGACCGALADQSPEGRWLLLATVAYLGSHGDTRASQRIGEELHSRWQRQLGEDHPDTLAAAAALTAELT
jgi:hypothetical protein